MGRSQLGFEFARTLGFAGMWERSELPQLAWDAVIDATNAAELPALALDLVEPGRRVVYIGIAATPSLIDTRDDGAQGRHGRRRSSPRRRVLPERSSSTPAGAVDPRPLVAATVSLDRTGDISRWVASGHATGGPKVHIDPRL